MVLHIIIRINIQARWFISKYLYNPFSFNVFYLERPFLLLNTAYQSITEKSKILFIASRVDIG
jgi:hypothetical protein